MSSRTKINKDSIRREVAADLGIKIDADDPLLLAAHIAAIATRDTIAQEREHNADNQLMSFGDVRTVLMDVRDDAVEINKQLLGIVLMRLDEEIRESTGRIVDDIVFAKALKLQRLAQWLCALLGVTFGVLIAVVFL